MVIVKKDGDNMIIKKYLIYIIVIVLFVFCFNIKVFALGDIIESGDEFLEKGNSVGETIKLINLRDVSNFFYKVFLSVGIAVAVIVGLVIGIRYIYEGAEGQAKLKEAFIPYIVGCFIVFSAFPIWKIVINFGNEFGELNDRVENEQGYDEYVYASQEVYLNVKAYFNHEEGASIPAASDYEVAWMFVTNYAFGEKQSSAKVFSNTWGEDRVEPRIYVNYLRKCATNEEIIKEFDDLIYYLNNSEDHKNFKIRSNDPIMKARYLKDYANNIWVDSFCDLYKEACGK